MTDTELSVLESLAKAATSGPWCIPSWREDLVYSEKGAQVVFCATVTSSEEEQNITVKQAEDNAAYIAAANPAAILSLIAELRQTKAERDWLAEMLTKMCSMTKCEKCKLPCPDEGYMHYDDEWLEAAKEAVCQK